MIYAYLFCPIHHLRVVFNLNPISWSKLFRIPVHIYETVEDKKDSICTESKEYHLKKAMFDIKFLTTKEENSVAHFPPSKKKKSLSYVIIKFLQPNFGSAIELSTAGL
jgi:hypothetical protein